VEQENVTYHGDDQFASKSGTIQCGVKLPGGSLRPTTLRGTMVVTPISGPTINRRVSLQPE
jgi:hypothetical protein